MFTLISIKIKKGDNTCTWLLEKCTMEIEDVKFEHREWRYHYFFTTVSTYYKSKGLESGSLHAAFSLLQASIPSPQFNVPIFLLPLFHITVGLEYQKSNKRWPFKKKDSIIFIHNMAKCAWLILFWFSSHRILADLCNKNLVTGV